MVAVLADHLLPWLDASKRLVHEGVTEPAVARLGHQTRQPVVERLRLLLPGCGHHQQHGQGCDERERPDHGARFWGSLM